MQQTGDDDRAGSRIYYLDPVAAGPLARWDAAFGHAAAMGFRDVLLPPIFAGGRGDDRFLVSDLAMVDPALTGGVTETAEAVVGKLAAQARAEGLRLMMDLVPDRLAAGGQAARRGNGLFRTPPPIAALDPRIGGARLNHAVADVSDAAAAGRLVEWWAPSISAWSAAGISGLRVLGLDRMAAAAAFLHDLRGVAPGLTLVGWTPGMAWEALPGLVGCGLDWVCNSLAWWDWRSDWLWREWQLLRRIAPVLACPEAAYGPRRPRAEVRPAVREAMARRGLQLAGWLGDGWLMAAGAETAATQPSAMHGTARPRGQADLTELVREINQHWPQCGPAVGDHRAPRPMVTADAPVLAVLVAPDRLVLANASPSRPQVQEAGALLPRLGWAGLRALAADQQLVGPVDRIVLAPGEVAAFAGLFDLIPKQETTMSSEHAREAAAQPRVAIEAVTPSVEAGRFAVKRLAGSAVDVEADLICDGHDKLAARVLWRDPGAATRGAEAWQEIWMRPLVNDRWTARVPLPRIGLAHFMIEAWKDGFESFRDELSKKHAAGVPTGLELQEGRGWLARAAERGAAPVAALLQHFDRLGADERRDLLLAEDTAALMRAADDRPLAARTVEYPIRAERLAAEFASWYEIFPRSMSDDPARHGTFGDVIRHLPRIRDMGFDVLYFPPIHPIGRTNRKGRNNSLTPGPDDPGSPYAIGAVEGGHDAVHPELGTIEDFRALRDAAAAEGLELALDFAIQCSPDHPWLSEHKGWFDWRPDGSIRYAENPPKKYEDIVNVDFYTEDAVPGLWLALAEIVMFWAGEGVRLFRVDNPHTKPLPFWEWLISCVQARYPDALFLAEAFTRPKVMYRLGKIGFSQSYTYFTWRNTPAEFRDYLTELTTTAPKDFFRPHFFVNTPDINPEFLQNSGRPGFLIRAALAATLSGLWGVYNGFELCEGRPLAPGKEEYIDSEKFEIRAWDWDRPGNIVADIARLNRLRRDNPALQSHLGVTFLATGNPSVLAYQKATPDHANVVVVAVSFDPFGVQETGFEITLEPWQLPDGAALEVTDLLSDQRSTWTGRQQSVRLTPAEPFRIWRMHPAS